MIDESNKIKFQGISLPLTDWLLAFVFLCVYPALFSALLLILDTLTNTNIVLSVSVVITGCLTLLLLYYYLKSHSELEIYAKMVGYVHFKPSYKDLLVNLTFNLFLISIQAIILFFIYFSIFEDPISIKDSLLFSTILSLAIQSIYLVFSQMNKKKLFKTAQESVPDSVLEFMRNNHPISKRISRFHFTDIKPASLFLSAGVTSSGLKFSLKGVKIDSTCVISRYFQWKLSEGELLAVLSHEQGHVKGNDIRNTYLLLGTDGWFRMMKIFSFMIIFSVYMQTFNNLNPISFVIPIIVLLFLLLGSGATLRTLQQNRIFLMEIRSDKFGAELVGNNRLATVLKKLPSVIPAPVDDNALGFLGFRVEILRNRAKSINEPVEESKIYSGPKIYRVN